MTEQENIHYRQGGKLTHCGCEVLVGGKDIESITVDHIEYKEKESVGGRVEEGVWVLYFAPNQYTQLPMILNVTNRKRLVKLFPECDGYLARLKNFNVRLTRERTRDVQDGGETWGLRISKIKPPQPSEQTAQKKEITADKVDAVVAWAKKGNRSIADIEAKYTMSAEIKQKLTDALSEPSDMPEN